MNRRLAVALAKLYTARPNTPRIVVTLSRRDAEKLPPLPTVAVISITTPGQPPAKLQAFGQMLRLNFEDIDFMAAGRSARSAPRLARCFTVEDAEAIWHFVNTLPSEICSVVVHCEGGYSRSCAVALALQHLHGFTTDLRQLTEANPAIYQLLLSTKKDSP